MKQKTTKSSLKVTRDASNPYEIWGNSPALPGWEWHVLKKWSVDDTQPNSRWFCNVKTPIVPNGEMGDVYVRDIKEIARAVKLCKGCRAVLRTPDVLNSLSRYGHGYICSDCGIEEALEGNFIQIK